MGLARKKRIIVVHLESNAEEIVENTSKIV